MIFDPKFDKRTNVTSLLRMGGCCLNTGYEKTAHVKAKPKLSNTIENVGIKLELHLLLYILVLLYILTRK